MKNVPPVADARPSPQRLESLDVYRGLTMLLLAFTVPNWGWQEPIAEAHPWLRSVMDQFEHARWRGLTLWDMIQPSFMFMVGVALPFSIASRIARGHTFGNMFLHALWRSFLLIALGIFLRSVGKPMTNFTFEDVLTQIGLGYPFLFALGFVRPRWQWTAAIGIL